MKSQTALIYARYSPKPKTKKNRDHDREESIEVQLAGCRECAARYGLTVGKEISEPGVSGFKTTIAERPRGPELLEEVASGKYAAVIVLRLDRLSRDSVDCLSTIRQWRRRGVSLFLANQGGNTINGGSPEGKLFLTMLAGFAEFERDLISTRTSESMRKQHRERVKKGNASRPAGYRVAADGVTLEPCALELAQIETIKKLTAKGHTPNEIAAAFATDGMLFRGRPWSPQFVRKVARRV
jgi:site-specific DNA recombinase